MPTIITDIVKGMFANRNREEFARKLRECSQDDSFQSDVSGHGSIPTADRPSEEYFFWGCELSRSRDTIVVKLDEDADEDQRHLLMLRHVVLGVNAIEGERNIVELQTTDFNDKEQRHPIASLTLGKTDFTNLDLCLTWSKTREIKLKLVKGSGPVSFTGNHHVEFLGTHEDAEELDDPDYVTEAETSADDSMILSASEAEDEELDANELKDLEDDAKAKNGRETKVIPTGEEGGDAKPTEVNGSSDGDSSHDGKRKRSSPIKASASKKAKNSDVSVKEVDLKS